jgi:exodeoxyribonuclease-5
MRAASQRKPVTTWSPEQDRVLLGIRRWQIADPAQLPPAGDEPAYFMDDPDIMLTEIHRQAAENPILHLADKIRRGKALPRPGYKAGDALRIIADDGNDTDYDVTLVGLNDTRHQAGITLTRAMAAIEPQGSEFDSVWLFNEAKYFRADAQRWLYTGISRARERLVIVSYD